MPVSELKVSPEKLADWIKRARAKDAIVPADFEVTPKKVFIKCGKCGLLFTRNLVPHVNDPVFACPEQKCQEKNFVPIQWEHPLL